MAARTDKRSILRKSYGKIGDYDRSKLWKYLDTGIAVKIAVHRVVVGCAYGFYMLPDGSAEFIRPNCMKLRLTRSVPFHHNSTRCNDFDPPKPRPAVSQESQAFYSVFNTEASAHLYCPQSPFFFRKIVRIERLPVQQD